MKMFKDGLQKAKYCTIILYSLVRCRSVVDAFGATYAVAGNVVTRIR